MQINMKLESRQIKAEIDKWRKILKLEPQWNIRFEIRNSSNKMSAGNEDALACIDVDLRYFVANIEFNAPEIEEKELDGIILHELLHIIIEPISCSSGCGLGKKFEEMNSILCESTIERLMPGYLSLYEQVYKKKIKKTAAITRKAEPRSIKCRRKK